jgi:alpha-galactosidase
MVANDGDTPVTTERIWSAQWHMPPGEGYRLTHLTGRHMDEMHLCRELLTQGIKLLESRRITASHDHNPWFAVDCGNADEDTGEVFWRAGLERQLEASAEFTDFASTRVCIGLNDWDFAWRLDLGESFTPLSSYAGYTTAGFGGASRWLHDFTRDTLLPHGHTIHKVLYNSWEATEFAVDQESQIQLPELAAEMGVELFVMNDGWFHGHDDDHAGLGDWWPDAQIP